MSSRNDASAVDGVEDRILDAAARSLAASSRHPGIAELARQAGVSRPTVYRRYADSDAVFRALWEREIRRLLDATPRSGQERESLVEQVALAEKISTNQALAATLVTDPSLAAHYLFDRLGTGQRVMLETLRAAIGELQAGGTIRAGDPDELAAMVLLIAQSAIASRHMIAEHLPETAWRRELTHALNGYLRP
jgi:AcrR family transcriptional regulator